MTTRSLGPLAGLHWLRRSIHLGRGNPRAVFGGAALLAGVALVPSIVQLLLLGAVQPGGEGAMAVAVAATLMSLLLMPPLIGGYLRVIDATERGLPARPTDVFAPFKQGQDAGRLIGLGMLITAIYLLMAWVVVSIFGDGLLTWYQQMAQLAQTPPVEPADLPAPPDGFGRVLGLVSLLALFLGGVYAIGFGQVALGGRRVALLGEQRLRNASLLTGSRDAFITDLDTRSAWGSVLQLGVELPIDPTWSVSLDARKIFLKTKATGTLPAFGGASTRADVRLNPLVVLLSVGRRF